MSSTESIATILSFIPILIFDFKGDFVDVPSRLGKDIWKHYSATDGFRVGIGPPYSCIQQVAWINQLTKLFAVHCDLKFSEATLASVIRIAFNLLYTLLTGTIIWPSLPLIEEMMKTIPWYLVARKEEYWRTALHKIEQINNVSGDLFNAENGFDLDEHLVKPKQCAVIDCTCLSPLLSHILVNLICLRILFARIMLRLTSKNTNLVLIIDEVDPLISYEACNKYPEGYNSLGAYVKHIREFGGVGAFGVSFLGQCDRFITSNITTSIIMNQSDPDSLREGAQRIIQPDSMSLISSLERGQAILKESMGSVNHGMLIKTDYVEPATMQRPGSFDIPPFTKARSIDEIPGFRAKLDQYIKQNKSAHYSQKSRTAKEELTKNEITFLKLLSLHEYELINLIFGRMNNPSPSVQSKLIKHLAKLKYIESDMMRSGRSPRRVARLTEKGWDYVKGNSKYPITKGDVIHAHICIWIMLLGIKLGYIESHCEWNIPGTTGSCDAAHLINGLWHLYEVVHKCESNINDHLHTAFIDASIEIVLVTIVTLKKSEHAKLEAKILADPELAFHINKVRFLTAEDIIKELWS